MVEIKNYLEYLYDNYSRYSIMFILLIIYAMLVIWNINDVLTIVIMTVTFVLGNSFAEYQEYRFKRAKKIDVDFRRESKK